MAGPLNPALDRRRERLFEGDFDLHAVGVVVMDLGVGRAGNGEGLKPAFGRADLFQIGRQVFAAKGDVVEHPAGVFGASLDQVYDRVVAVGRIKPSAWKAKVWAPAGLEV